MCFIVLYESYVWKVSTFKWSFVTGCEYKETDVDIEKSTSRTHSLIKCWNFASNEKIAFHDNFLLLD